METDLTQSGQKQPGGAPEVVLLQDGKNDCAFLFFVHPVAGGVGSYVRLCSYITNDIGIIGLDSPRDLSGVTNSHFVADVARHYAEAVVEIAGSHPVVLCGWSMGASIAFAMTDWLARNDASPYALVLIDPDSATSMENFGSAIGLSAKEEEIWIAYENIVVGQALMPRLLQNPLYVSGTCLQKLELITSMCNSIFPEGEQNAGGAVHDFEFFKRAYVSKIALAPTVFEGRAALILSKNCDRSVVENDWRKLCPSISQVRQLEASHTDLIRDPVHARNTAEVINGYIRELAAMR